MVGANPKLDKNFRKVDKNFEEALTKMTPLHWAAYNNDLGVVSYLLKQEAVSKLNSRGLAPVDIAALCENWEVVREMCRDFNHRTKEDFVTKRHKSLNF